MILKDIVFGFDRTLNFTQILSGDDFSCAIPDPIPNSEVKATKLTIV